MLSCEAIFYGVILSNVILYYLYEESECGTTDSLLFIPCSSDVLILFLFERRLVVECIRMAWTIDDQSQVVRSAVVFVSHVQVVSVLVGDAEVVVETTQRMVLWTEYASASGNGICIDLKL